jgi:hypothetical protein
VANDPQNTPTGANPVLVDHPAATRNLHSADEHSNPAVTGRLGSTVAPAKEGVVQTTIDTDTTTIHPEASILNPVKPDGSEAPLKQAVVGQTTAQTSRPASTQPQSGTQPKVK